MNAHSCHWQVEFLVYSRTGSKVTVRLPFNVQYILATDGFIGDSPESAELATISLLRGDIIVLATDGLWDNVSEEKIVEQLAGLKSGDVQVCCMV